MLQGPQFYLCGAVRVRARFFGAPLPVWLADGPDVGSALRGSCTRRCARRAHWHETVIRHHDDGSPVRRSSSRVCRVQVSLGGGVPRFRFRLRGELFRFIQRGNLRHCSVPARGDVATIGLAKTENYYKNIILNKNST